MLNYSSSSPDQIWTRHQIRDPALSMVRDLADLPMAERALQDLHG